MGILLLRLGAALLLWSGLTGGAGGGVDGPLHLHRLHPDPPGHTPRVGRAQGRIPDRRDHRHDGAHGPHPPLQGLQVVVLQGHPDRELEQGPLGLQQVPHGPVPAGQTQIARVHPVRGHAHVGLGGEALILLEGVQRGLLPGLVAVEGEDHLSPGAVIAQQAPHDLDVPRAEGRAAGGHGRLHPGQVRGHHVRIPLDDDRLLSLGDLPLGQIDAVEHLGLLVQGGLRGVQVLRPLVILEQLPRPEADGLPRDGADGPDQAPPEPVVQSPPTLGEHTRGLQLLLGEAVVPQVLEQVGPALRGVADAEALRRGAVESAPAEETLGGGGLAGVELALEELLGDLVRVHQPLPPALLLPVRAAPVLVVQLVAHAGGQPLHGLGEAGVVHGHEEGDDVPGLPAAEAVVGAHLRADVEGGGALVVEGAQPLVGADAGGLQRHVALDDLPDVRARADLVDVFASNQTSHGRILAAGSPSPSRIPQSAESRHIPAGLTRAACPRSARTAR
ncbi:Uncharacterised protein [Mycobacteroides abscessus subsp. abscessus]|nr:Uncharacterised protein [Mycobacteroides abscessus subsp. abscessus]